MRDKESIRREIAKLKLPAVVTEIFDGTAPRKALTYRCTDPWKSLVNASGFPVPMLPLWECGTTVTAYDSSDGTFCQIDLEAPDEVRLRVRSFDEIVADLLIDLWEDEIPDDALADVASQFEFNRLPHLVTALEAGPIGDYDAWRTALLTDSQQASP